MRKEAFSCQLSVLSKLEGKSRSLASLGMATNTPGKQYHWRRNQPIWISWGDRERTALVAWARLPALGYECDFWRSFRSNAWRASRASCAAWKDAGGNPPRECASDSGRMVSSSLSSLPWMSSVRRDAEAIAAVQPRQRKRASRMRRSSRIAASCRMSPQTGLLTSTLAVAPGSSPALRGCWK
jgi:hypothetical protein